MATSIASALALMACTGFAAGADLSLPSIISDHAVLQRSPHCRIWGWANTGDRIIVSLGKARGTGTAGADGRWTVEMDLAGAPAGPDELVVEGRARIVVKDVLVGDVWLCSGQSNMAFSLDGALGAVNEIDHSANPSLRQFKVAETVAAAPQERVEGAWTVAGPADSGKFSAVAYFFGKTLQEKLKRPIGLVNAAYPASSAQSWTSIGNLEADALRDRDRFLGLPQRFREHVARLSAWTQEHHRQDHPGDPAVFADPAADTAGWTPVTLPGTLADAGLPDTGAAWVRRSIAIDAGQAGKELTLTFDKLELGSVYWNGEKIDEVTPDTQRFAVSWEPAWTIRVKAERVRAGTATLAIRLFTPAGGASLRFDAKRNPLLAGEWLARSEFAFEPLDAAAKDAYPGIPPVKDFYDHFSPSSLYDGMLNPLRPFAFTGVIWYQGEGNTWQPDVYRRVFPRMIADWRDRLGSELPFLLCQLPNHGAKSPEPGENQWAELREAQSLALKLPRTGEAVLIDTADADLHPRNKRDPGERLAKIALSQVYGETAICSGPVFDAISIEGANMRVTFTNPDGILVAKPLPANYVVGYRSPDPASAETAPLALPSQGSEIQGFAIRGEDRQWHWAQARIEHASSGKPRDSIVAWSGEVPKPIAIRYAWAENPTCNLVNGAGWPACPFRSDAPSPEQAEARQPEH